MNQALSGHMRSALLGVCVLLLIASSWTGWGAETPPISPGSVDLEIKGRVEPPGPYSVGDRMRVVWELYSDPRIKVESDLTAAALKSLQDAGLEPVDAGDGASPAMLSNSKEKDRQIQRLSVPVTTFTTGVHRIAPVMVTYKDVKGAVQKVATPEMVVPILSTLSGAKPEPRPFKDPVPYPYRFSLPTWVWIVLASVAVLGMILFRRWRAPRLAFVAPPLPPHEEATRRIEALLAEGLVAVGQVKEFCDRLSDILRDYLGKRYGLSSMGETSHELILTMTSGNHLGPDQLSGLTQFLEECDLAKFARHTPSSTDLDGLVQTARRMIDITRPVVVPSGQEVKP